VLLQDTRRRRSGKDRVVVRIECHKCHKYLGEIVSGSKLRKGIVIFCSECGIILRHEAGDKHGAACGFADMLRNITGGK